jgi:hypothetical protein
MTEAFAPVRRFISQRTVVMRAGVAATYGGAWLAVGTVQPAWSDSASGVFWIGSSVAAGLLIGRWWAVGLAALAAVALLVGSELNPCVWTDAVECDVNVPALVLGMFMPVTAFLLTLGVALRKLVRPSARSSPRVDGP